MMTPSSLTLCLSNPGKILGGKKTNYSSTEHGIKPQFEIYPVHGRAEVESQYNAASEKNEYFQIIYLTHGCCECRVDLNHYNISNQNLGFVRPGQRVGMDFCPDAKGYILRLTTQYLNASIERSSSLNPAVWMGICCLPTLDMTESERIEMSFILDSIARQRYGMGQSKTDLFGLEVINGLSKVFLIYLSRILAERTGFKKTEKASLVEKFFSLLESRYKIFKTPADYADALEISSGYLNELLKKNCGFTTSYYISQRVVMEAKRLVVYSDTSMKEIAYELGFDDMSHFSKIFKRVSGESFTEYRKKSSAVV